MTLSEMRADSRYSVAIRDPVWKHIWITPELQSITHTAPFLRLHRIKQLGPAEFIYPGATHTRSAHSIGVYHLSRRILNVLLDRGADSWVSAVGYASFLCAALLHDLGHFPFTHSLKELPLMDHEQLTARYIRSEELKIAIGKAGGDPEMVAAIVDKRAPLQSPDDRETLFYRNLLSGVLDPDKLDYLNRDAYYCGVPYGIQDTDFILSRITPHQNLGMMLDSRSVMAIESLLFSKYLMYRSVYWHRQVRIATAMMKKALFGALSSKAIAAEELYSLDDEGLFSLIAARQFPHREVALSLRNREFYQVVAEFHFDPANALLGELENLSKRTRREDELAALTAALTGLTVENSDILIDIPERVSFECDVRISDQNRSFSESNTVFSPSVVEQFTSSLRIIRIAIHQRLTVNPQKMAELSEKLADWFQVVYTGYDISGRN